VNLSTQTMMDSIFKFPTSPGTPLFPVSPERVNRQPLPQSPSLPSNLSDPFFSGHARAPSDVQGKVAQFNNLSKENAQRRRDNEAALQRAVLGREEAEGETRRLREEHRLLRKEIEEGRGRERRVGERLEALMVGSSMSWRSVLLISYFRRNYNGRKRRTRTPRRSMRKRFEEPARKLSKLRAQRSSYRRT